MLVIGLRICCNEMLDHFPGEIPFLHLFPVIGKPGVRDPVVGPFFAVFAFTAVGGDQAFALHAGERRIKRGFLDNIFI